MFCTNCGSAIKPDLKFCDSCGAEISQVNTPTVIPKPSTKNIKFQVRTTKTASATNSKALRKFALIFGLVICVLIVFFLTSRDSGGGIPNGRFVPVSQNDMGWIMLPFSSLEFRGNQVTAGMANDTMLETVRYTYENGRLRFRFSGESLNLPIYIVDRDTLRINLDRGLGIGDSGTVFVRE